MFYLRCNKKILSNFSTLKVKSLISDLFFLQVFEIKKFPRRFSRFMTESVALKVKSIYVDYIKIH